MQKRAEQPVAADGVPPPLNRGVGHHKGIRMKRVESKPEDHNIYCTAADSADHSLLCLPATALLRQIKLCSILGEHVYLSVSHIYENPETAALLTQNLDLLISGLIAVGLRSDCRDFSDFLEMRGSEERHTSQKDRDLTRFLNSNTDTVITWTPSDMQPHFKDAIRQALANPQSALRKRLTATKKADILEFASAVADMPDNEATRSRMKRLALQYVPHRVNAFMREVNLLYYIMGSRDKNLAPHLDPRLFADLAEGYRRSIATPYTGRPLDRWLDETLRHMLFPVELLELLTVAQIAEFRKDHRDSIARFRNKWWSAAIAGLDTNQISGLRNESHALQRLLREVQKETAKIAKYDKIVKAVSMSSLLLSISALVPNPVLAALSFLISVGAYTVSSDNVKHRLLGTDMAALTSSLSTFMRERIAQQSAAADGVPPPLNRGVRCN